jgi:hypothetical protein
MLLEPWDWLEGQVSISVLITHLIMETYDPTGMSVGWGENHAFRAGSRRSVLQVCLCSTVLSVPSK